MANPKSSATNDEPGQYGPAARDNGTAARGRSYSEPYGELKQMMKSFNELLAGKKGGKPKGGHYDGGGKGNSWFGGEGQDSDNWFLGNSWSNSWGKNNGSGYGGKQHGSGYGGNSWGNGSGNGGKGGGAKGKVCRFYLARKCQWGDKCRESHVLTEEKFNRIAEKTSLAQGLTWSAKLGAGKLEQTNAVVKKKDDGAGKNLVPGYDNE